MRTYVVGLSFVAVSCAACVAWTGNSAAQTPYSKAVQRACGADYHTFCGEYGLETAALRTCMDKAGRSLSKPCVQALIESGEVSQAEVDRRKKSGR
jgi:hypothetical protein